MGKKSVIPWVLFGALVAGAADFGPDLLNAAKKGQTSEVKSLLEKGAPADSADKAGRTALMLAAQHGHAETVSVLLAKGAKPEAHDEEGLNAYALAFLSTAKGREQVLGLLPPHAHVRLVLEAEWIPGNLASSCFMTTPQLADHMRQIKPDALAAAAVRDVFAAKDSRFLELTPSEGDAVLHLRVRPGAMCVQQQSVDDLRMEIDAWLIRAGSEAPVWQKTYGGGLKGMKARMATSAVQYSALYQEWAKAEAEPIYTGAITALLKQ